MSIKWYGENHSIGGHVTNTIDYLIPLVYSAITGVKPDLPDDIGNRFSNIIDVACRHEIAHLAAMALIKYNLITDEKQVEIARKLVYDASYRDIKNNYTYNLASKVLTDGKICFIPLKGVILKELYPESFMRTSCDTDILVKKQDFERAVSLFQNIGFEIDGDLNFHDVSLIYDDSNLELHFSICENNKKLDYVLKDVWDYSVKSENYKYLETNDFFVFHHIAHMAYHFLAGGCGIRPFLDYYVLKKNNYFDEQEVVKLCEKAKIGDFYKAVKMLTDVWFGKSEHTEFTRRIEKYILTGGAYGYFPNNAAAYTVMNGGKIKYVLSLAFPKYSNMRVLYPILNRFPAMLPFFYIYRVYEKLFGKSSERAKERYKVIKGQGKDFVREVASLIKELKLN